MFDVTTIRRQFPALARTKDDAPVIYFDGPAGSQAPRSVADAVRDYLIHTNANHGGPFATSRESDIILEEAHRATADLVGAGDPDCIVFGANMTTLAFALSRSLAKTWKAGEEVIVTRLDHDANVTPWMMAARDAGATVKYVDIRAEDCTLDMDDFRAKLSDRTRLVAVGCASNATGTINPVAEIVKLSHAAGALVFLDAVHYAPHGLLDVTAWDCDFLACSAYKFFGPHVGVLYGKRRWLEELPAYKVRPASDAIPGRWETGTSNHEGIAGTLAAIEYLADLGRSLEFVTSDRRSALRTAYYAIRTHETGLAKQFLDRTRELPGLRVYGIRELSRLGERVSTFSFTMDGHSPLAVAEYLAQRGIYVWHGNYYALALTEALGLEPHGMVRVGLLHYNTAEEVERLFEALKELVSKN